jgi:hypothetical protein
VRNAHIAIEEVQSIVERAEPQHDPVIHRRDWTVSALRIIARKLFTLIESPWLAESDGERHIVTVIVTRPLSL